MIARLSSLPAIRQPLSWLAGVRALFPLTREKAVRLVKTRSFAIVLYAVLGASVLTAAALQTKVVRVEDGSGTRVVYTFRSDAADILRQSGIRLTAADTYSFTGIRNHYGVIKFYAAFPVKVTADGKSEDVMFAHGTVADLLAKAGVTVGENDEVSLPLSAQVTKDTSVSVARVRYEETSTATALPFAVETVNDSTLAQGKTKVLQQGQNGTLTVRTKSKYVDGKLAEQTELSRSEVPAVNRKVAVGTAVVRKASVISSAAAVTGVPASYKKIITGVATAYTANSSGRTATGTKLARGVVAVDPGQIPYGTKLYITTPGGSHVYGTAVAADTGGFVTNGSGIIADLYYPTSAEVSSFGKRTVNIYVLN